MPRGATTRERTTFTASETVQALAASPELVIRMFRYDPKRRSWVAKSTTQPGVEYAIGYCISGYDVTYRCECPGFAFRRDCRHIRIAEKTIWRHTLESCLAEPIDTPQRAAARMARIEERYGDMLHGRGRSTAL